ncbi:winged helix-turn-helix domain-containing protein [Nitratireductor sp. GCM10026969]|uniref:winged helix-turn-helix domain-containing protein n=1 Tax=Nitratireductor sp. GCM10026969 TaxID=3252645 RepID=UPI003605DDE4
MAEAGELTLDELCAELEARGVSVHRSNVARLLHRLGLSHKKLCRPANRSGPTSVRRARFGVRGASASSPRPCRAWSSSTRRRPTPS